MSSSPRVTFDSPKTAKCSCSSIFRFLGELIVEPLLCMVFFSYFTRNVSAQEMTKEKACKLALQNAKSNQTNCTSGYLEDEAQRIASQYQMFSLLVAILPSVLVSMLMIPWSNKYGRRIPLLISLIGMTLGSIIDMLNAIYIDAHIGYTLLSTIPYALGGNIIIILTVTYSYISDSVQEQSMRAIHYAMVELAIFVGMPLGTLAGGQIYKHEGYESVFGVSAVGFIVGILWAVFVFKEKRTFDKDVPFKQKVRDFFSIENMKINFRICLKKRDGNVRAQIWLINLAMAANIFNSMGPMTNGLYFCEKVFHWDETKYSNVQAVVLLINAFFTITLVPVLTKVVRMRDVFIAFIGVSSSLTSSVLKAISKAGWFFIVGSIAGCLSTLTSVASRSRLSKLVLDDEIGSIFSVLSFCEAIAPIVAGIAFSQVYKETLDFFPGMFFLVGSFCLLITGSVYIFIWRWGTLPPKEIQQQPPTVEVEDIPTTKDDVNLIPATTFGDTDTVAS